MQKRDELTDPGSCMSRAGDDEWVFVLLARDEDAPGTVRDWIGRRVARGKSLPTDPEILEARDWILRAQEQQRRAGPAAESEAADAAGREQVELMKPWNEWWAWNPEGRTVQWDVEQSAHLRARLAETDRRAENG